MTLHELGLFSGPHHQALEVLCAKALESGDAAAAFRFSDRRCRIRPLPESHCYVLRAEALYRMGDRAGAVEDLATAIRIAPDDLAANRRMLAWGRARQRIAAAKILIRCEHDMSNLQKAIAVLRDDGQTAFARLWVSESVVEGWAVWFGSGSIRVSIASDGACIERHLESDRQHPLASKQGRAVGFCFPRPPARESHFISVVSGDKILTSLQTTSHHSVPAPVIRSGAMTAGCDNQVTVIVPVYADYRATKACLESLLRQLGKGDDHRVLIINDASPDPRISKLLNGLAPKKNLRVLVNTRNLGFVGAINRALTEVSSGDVVLLNADTIVPGGFIGRLAAVARSSPDIGTVTPLSNNGEFTSFPVPNQPNALGTASDIGTLDRITARVNAGVVVDIPNGIGFCLYVTRACLDAVGALSESYHRGYLEDVDFCLRARQNGFRNVCAASVYVGHAGSRSFGKQKRSLVVRNLEVIQRRFPAYRAECADFILADPLKAARRSIEICIPPSHSRGTLLVTCSGPVADVARARARELLAGQSPAVLVLEFQFGPGRSVAKIRDIADAAPQSLEFNLPDDYEDLLDYLRRLKLARMELFDFDKVPSAVRDRILGLSIPYDLFMARPQLEMESVSAQTTRKHASTWREQSDPDTFLRRRVMVGADRVLAPDAQAEVSALSLHRNITRLDATGVTPIRQPKLSRTPAARLGLIPVCGGVQEHQLIREVTAGVKNVLPNLEMIIAGATFDDFDYFRTSEAFVTGSIDAAELELVFRRYQFDRILLCLTQPLFGHPIVSATMALPLPVAYFDWSSGHCRVRQGDLPLNPTHLVADVVKRLAPWLRGNKLI